MSESCRGVERDHHPTAAVRRQVGRQAGRSAGDGRAVHPVGTGAQRTAQPGRTELQPPGEPILDLVPVLAPDQQRQLGAGARVRVVGDPAHRCGAEVAHAGLIGRSRRAAPAARSRLAISSTRGWPSQPPTCSCSQTRWYGTCTARAPSSITGTTSLRMLLPTMRNRSGGQPRTRSSSAYFATFFSLMISTWSKALGEPGLVELALLVQQVTLGDQDHPVTAGPQRPHRLVGTRQQLDRGADHAAGEVEDLLDQGGVQVRAGQLGSRLDGGQREALDAVPEQGQVATLDPAQGGVDQLGVGEVGHERTEVLLCGVEQVLAAPQRVVAVEPDDIDRLVLVTPHDGQSVMRSVGCCASAHDTVRRWLPSSTTLPTLLTGHRRRLPAVVRPASSGSVAHEYLWEPTADAWTVRPVDGRWVADWADPDPEPAPVTTIAWRTWHIGLQCLASYVSPSLGDWPLPVRGRTWFGEVGPALAASAGITRSA